MTWAWVRAKKEDIVKTDEINTEIKDYHFKNKNSKSSH